VSVAVGASPLPVRRLTGQQLAAIGVVVSSWEAGGVHLLEAREHGEWWLPAGVFFALIGLFQVVSAVAFMWQRRPLLLHAMVWANVGTVAVYVISRTVGLPGSPGIPLHGAALRAGTPFLRIEPVVSAEFVVLLAEVLVATLCAALLAGRARGRTINALWITGMALLGGSWITTLL
jgi:hypothetical protein